jgi:bacterial/archaeal transporter family protein
MSEWRNASPFVWAALAMVCWGVAPLFEKAGLVKIAPLPATALRSWMIGLCLLGTVTFSGAWKEVAGVDLRSLGLLLAGGLLAGLLAQVMYFAALRGGQASQIVPFTAAYPLVTMVLSVLLLREPVTLPRAAGAVCVAVGVLLLKLGG